MSEARDTAPLVAPQNPSWAIGQAAQQMQPPSSATILPFNRVAFVPITQAAGSTPSAPPPPVTAQPTAQPATSPQVGAAPDWLVASVSTSEHSGDQSVSPKGAVGKMQVLPTTAAPYLRPGETLDDPTVNRRVGAAIINDLWQRYAKIGDPVTRATAVKIGYNAGPGVADQWIASGGDPSILPAETRKYIGMGGAAAGGAGGMPSDIIAQSAQSREALEGLRKETEALGKKLSEINVRDPEAQKALADYRRKMEEYQQAALQTALRPPVSQPQDFMGRMGGIATLVGILGGLLTKQPLMASLNAGAAAMEAYNKGDQLTYQQHMQQWKVSTDALFKMADFEHQMFKDTLDDEKLTQSEKIDLIKAQGELLGHQQAIMLAEGGNPQRLLQNYLLIQAAQDRRQKLLDEEARAGGAGAGLEASKTLEILDKDDNVVRTVLAREGRGKAGWVDSASGQPLQLGPGEHPREVTPSAGGGGRAGAQVLRQEIGGREVLSDLQNAVSMPVGSTTGVFGTYQPGTSISDALHGDLVRKLTSQDAQLMQASMASLSRELSILMSPVYGGNWAAQQIDPLIPKSGDTLGTTIFKLARLAQSADNALEAVSKAPVLSGEQKAFAVDLRKQIQEAVPWTAGQAMSFARQGEGGESFRDFVKRQGISGAGAAGMPAWATQSASGPGGERIYTDGKNWFRADHTPIQ